VQKVSSMAHAAFSRSCLLLFSAAAGVRIEVAAVRSGETETRTPDPITWTAKELTYIAGIRATYAAFGPEVPFHNLEHAENIKDFASWYADKAHFPADAKKLLVLAAISHDAGHPGTPNNVENVTNTFIPKLPSILDRVTHKVPALKFTEHEIEQIRKKGLSNLAEEVWSELKAHVNASQMKLAFGFRTAGAHIDALRKEVFNGNYRGGPIFALFNAFLGGGVWSDAEENVPGFMAERAPQEVVHSWIVLQLLKKIDLLAGDPMSIDKPKLLINILMTSIALHFHVLKYEEAYVNKMCQDPYFKTFQCGLLLHVLDMGWCTQYQCAEQGACTTKSGAKPGLVFGPRFLAESGMYNKPEDGVAKGEAFFTDLVGKMVTNLKKTGTFFPSDELADTLLEGAQEHMHLVKRGEAENTRMGLEFKQATGNLVSELGKPKAEWMSQHKM